MASLNLGSTKNERMQPPMTAIDTDQRDIAQLDTTRRIDVSQIAVAKLAQDKGCTLKMQTADDAPFYWVENGYFISRPFCRLTELKRFIQKLPIVSGQ
jgi:hypothetical protein